MQSVKSELIDLLCEKSFKFSATPTFKLASGKISNYYVNCRPTTLNHRGMYLVGALMHHLLKDKGVTAVGGLTFGADPIAVATAFTSEIKGQPINAFSIRKEQKDHGVVQWVEGDIPKGAKVAIIDDVATTGGSTIKAIERARADGLDVVCVAVLVDRQEGGLENIRQHVAEVSALITKDELLAHYKQINNVSV